jgi:hypothetical protein
VWQIQEQILRQILSIKQGAFLVARGAKVEGFAGKWAEVGMAAVVAAYPGHAFGPVSTVDVLVYPIKNIGRRIGVSNIASPGLAKNSLNNDGAMRNIRRHTLLYVGTCVLPALGR